MHSLFGITFVLFLLLLNLQQEQLKLIQLYSL